MMVCRDEEHEKPPTSAPAAGGDAAGMATLLTGKRFGGVHGAGELFLTRIS